MVTREQVGTQPGKRYCVKKLILFEGEKVTQVPSRKPTSKRSSKPTIKPSIKVTNKPSIKPTTKSTIEPTSKPADLQRKSLFSHTN
ncbi:unnamed protein product [Plasmodium vivax]|uniref:(malaria parasite P. vivax) hypothetical protein n=1 Tax=Plasmodium vivax TaxID=5855 RepID=A0A8S4HCD4_PLAVI|nr:unnamed protein product [Plasmodium vivax]